MKMFANSCATEGGTFMGRMGVGKTISALVGSMACFALIACGSQRSLPQVGAITFTDGIGNNQAPLTALKAGGGTYLDVDINDDVEFLGATWAVSCSNQPPVRTPLPPGQTVDNSCGTFSPSHTISGPVPQYATTGAGYVTFYTAPVAVPKDGTVTLYASSTSDPSQYSIVTLTITQQ